jgi:hypothetical protein
MAAHFFTCIKNRLKLIHMQCLTGSIHPALFLSQATYEVDVLNDFHQDPLGN